MEILLIAMYLSEYSGQEGASACTLQTLDLNHYMERGRSCIRDFTLIPTKYDTDRVHLSSQENLRRLDNCKLRARRGNFEVLPFTRPSRRPTCIVAGIGRCRVSLRNLPLNV